jgi:hypothetical protein
MRVTPEKLKNLFASVFKPGKDVGLNYDPKARLYTLTHKACQITGPMSGREMYRYLRGISDAYTYKLQDLAS